MVAQIVVFRRIPLLHKLLHTRKGGHHQHQRQPTTIRRPAPSSHSLLDCPGARAALAVTHWFSFRQITWRGPGANLGCSSDLAIPNMSWTSCDGSTAANWLWLRLALVERATCVTLRRRSAMFVCDCGQIGGMAWAGGVSTYAASPAPIADLVDARHG